MKLAKEKQNQCQFDEYFTNCFSFSMNDEVIDTGFAKMTHCISIIGVGVKNEFKY